MERGSPSPPLPALSIISFDYKSCYHLPGIDVKEIVQKRNAWNTCHATFFPYRIPYFLSFSCPIVRRRRNVLPYYCILAVPLRASSASPIHRIIVLAREQSRAQSKEGHTQFFLTITRRVSLSLPLNHPVPVPKQREETDAYVFFLRWGVKVKSPPSGSRPSPIWTNEPPKSISLESKQP